MKALSTLVAALIALTSSSSAFAVSAGGSLVLAEPLEFTSDTIYLRSENPPTAVCWLELNRDLEASTESPVELPAGTIEIGEVGRPKCPDKNCPRIYLTLENEIMTRMGCQIDHNEHLSDSELQELLGQVGITLQSDPDRKLNP